MLTPAFYGAIPFERFLLIQTDSMVCRRDWSRTTGLGRWADRFDYIGAPWTSGGCCNGGFSWRSRDKSFEIVDLRRPNLRHGNEDEFFSAGIADIGGAVPDFPEATLFALEATTGLEQGDGGVAPWGVHKFFAYCPDYRERLSSGACEGLEELERLNRLPLLDG
jgi:hypothetical protein